MVGIARARGCGTCRKRKIACGLEKPACAQCIKSKRVCAGYRKYPVFIAHQPFQSENTKIPEQIDPDPDPDADPTTETPKEGGIEFNSQKDHASRKRAYEDKISALVPLGAAVDANPAVRQQMFEVFLDNHLSKERLGGLLQRIWLVKVPTLPYLTTSLEVSLAALSLAKLGELSGNQALVRDSLQLYHRALHELQQALWDPDLMLHDQTLTTCAALGMYEMSQCPNKSKQGYISHTLGCQRIIQLRGPEAHVDGLGHAVFVHFRIQGILYALEQGVTSFLGDPIWQEVPWRKRPKTPYDRVYDFLIRAPELRGKGDMIQFLDPPSQLQLATELIWQLWAMESEMQLLYSELEATQGEPLFWSQLARNEALHGDSDEGLLFPVAFHFSNLAVFNTVVIFWAVQVILWHGLWQLYRLIGGLQLYFSAQAVGSDGEGGLESTGDTFSSRFLFPPLEHRADFAAPCRNILQSIEYGLQEEMLDQGPRCVAGPLAIAYETLRAYPQFHEEAAWASRAREQVHSRSLRLLMYYKPRR